MDSTLTVGALRNTLLTSRDSCNNYQKYKMPNKCVYLRNYPVSCKFVNSDVKNT